MIEKKLDEIIGDYETWCSCGNNLECAKSDNYRLAKQAILALIESEVIDELEGLGIEDSNHKLAADLVVDDNVMHTEEFVRIPLNRFLSETIGQIVVASEYESWVHPKYPK